jgi:predicted ATPase
LRVDELRILGPVEVLVDGRAVPLGGPKQRALLALLLLNANEVVSRERAIDFLWAEHPPERAVNALQVYIHGLRRLLGADRIARRGSGYQLLVEAEELDLLRFQRLREGGQAALTRGDPGVAAMQLGEALGLWRGEPLSDLALDSLGESERGRLEELRLGALELRIEAELALGRQEGLIAELEALVGEHPWRERLRAQLMLALYRAGRQAEALAAYQAARQELGDQLGIEPSPLLRELERAVLRQDPSLGLAAESAVETNLPRPATRLVGRRLEVASVCSLLREPDVRLLTLTGTGGVGKTRLAIEAAAELAEGLEHGVVFVDLAPLADPTLIESTLAAALGVVDQPGEPTRQLLIERLRGRELLLVLDNFERLLAAAPLVAELLAAAPRVRVLATSRTLLRLGAEHEYLVPPLAVPSEAADLAALARNDSVSVFIARARALEQSFLLTDANAAVIAAICRRLEGLPLALELAAARVKLLPPEQILERIGRPLELLSGGARDLPARQQTLRATIDWSYQLLDQKQKVLFAQLAVFAGGCTLEAAERVCDAELETFAALLDNSLLRREQDPGREPRFGMLETVREYAAERLEAAGTGAVPRRHAEYFAALAEQLGPDLVGPRAQAASGRLLEEHENLRAALAYALNHDRELGFRLAAAVRPYWGNPAHGREIRAWLEQAFGRKPSAATQSQVGALIVLGRQLMNDGDYDASRTMLEQAVEAGRRLDCTSEAAVALTYLAWLSAAAGDHEQCQRLGEEAISLGRRSHNRWAERQGLAMVAGTLVNRKQHDEARAYLDRSLALAELLQDTNTIVLATVNSAYGALSAGDLGRARSLLEGALERCRRRDQAASAASVLFLLAWEAGLSGDRQRARAFLREALQILYDEPQLSIRADVLSEVALTLEKSAPRTAGRLLGAADAAFSLRGIKRGIPARERIEPLHSRLAAKLGEDELAAAHGHGARLSIDEAIAEALRAVDT